MTRLERLLIAIEMLSIELTGGSNTVYVHRDRTALAKAQAALIAQLRSTLQATGQLKQTGMDDIPF